MSRGLKKKTVSAVARSLCTLTQLLGRPADRSLLFPEIIGFVDSLALLHGRRRRKQQVPHAPSVARSGTRLHRLGEGMFDCDRGLKSSKVGNFLIPFSVAGLQYSVLWTQKTYRRPSGHHQPSERVHTNVRAQVAYSGSGN